MASYSTPASYDDVVRDVEIQFYGAPFPKTADVVVVRFMRDQSTTPAFVMTADWLSLAVSIPGLITQQLSWITASPQDLQNAWAIYEIFAAASYAVVTQTYQIMPCFENFVRDFKVFIFPSTKSTFKRIRYELETEDRAVIIDADKENFTVNDSSRPAIERYKWPNVSLAYYKLIVTESIILVQNSSTIRKIKLF